MGGTDDPNNIVELTIEEHAQAHRELYEKHGHWQDKVAYEGLSGQIPSKQVIAEVYKQNGLANVHNLHTKKIKAKARQRTKEVNTGRVFTPEHRRKISEAGINRPVSESQKKKVAEALSKEFTIITPENKKLHIKNLREFALKHGLDQGNLTKVAQGKLKQHKGYIVSYKG